jgi:hypothetical protein
MRGYDMQCVDGVHGLCTDFLVDVGVWRILMLIVSLGGAAPRVFVDPATVRRIDVEQCRISLSIGVEALRSRPEFHRQRHVGCSHADLLDEIARAWTDPGRSQEGRGIE